MYYGEELKMATGVTVRRRAQLLALSLVGLASATIDNDAPAYEIRFNDTASVGPDGECRFNAV